MGEVFLLFLVIVFFYSIVSSFFELLFGTKKKENTNTIKTKAISSNNNTGNCDNLRREWINNKNNFRFPFGYINCISLAKEVLHYQNSINKRAEIGFRNFFLDNLRHDRELIKSIIDNNYLVYSDLVHGGYNSLLLDLEIARYVFNKNIIYFKQLPKRTQENKEIAKLFLKHSRENIYKDFDVSLKLDKDIIKLAIIHSKVELIDIPNNVVKTSSDDLLLFLTNYYPLKDIYNYFILSNEQKLLLIEKDINFFNNLKEHDKEIESIKKYLKFNFHKMGDHEKKIASDYLPNSSLGEIDISIEIEIINRFKFQFWKNNNLLKELVFFDTFDFLELYNKGKIEKFNLSMGETISIGKYISKKLNDWDYLELIIEDGSCFGNVSIQPKSNIEIKTKNTIYNGEKIYIETFFINENEINLNDLFVTGSQSRIEKNIIIKEEI